MDKWNYTNNHYQTIDSIILYRKAQMTFAIQSLFPTYPTIFVDEQVAAPAENVKRWLSVIDHTFDDGRKCRLLITWTACPDFPATYEPIADLSEDGTLNRFLAGMLQPDMTYKTASTLGEFTEFTKTVALLNPATDELYNLPYSAMCVSNTLRNMIDDLGGVDDTPIPIGSNIVNGTLLNTLRMLQMLQILANPTTGSDVIRNWSHSEIHEIECDVRIPQIDAILKAHPLLDETPREAEIASAVGYPQFKFVAGWTDHVALDYYVTAVDFLDIQPLCMYIAHAYASKMANI